MYYFRPYTYFLSKPGGTTNLLYGSLALLTGLFIPLVGQVVMLGYAAEVAEDLEHDPDLTEHRDFNFNKLTDYLSRGLWPMVTQVVILVLYLFLVVVAAIVGVAVYAAGAEVVIAAVAAGIILLPSTTFMALIVWPMTLHSQLSRGFRLGGAIRFTASMLRKVGVQLVLALIVNSILSFFLSLFGMMLCFIGVYPAMMIQVMAQEHFTLQLYRLYLDEGGERIVAPGDRVERSDDDDR